MSQAVNLNFVSWNCRGLQQLRKIKQVMNKIKEAFDTKVRRKWQGSEYTDAFSSRARGVMILIHKAIPFQVKNVIRIDWADNCKLNPSVDRSTGIDQPRSGYRTT